MRKSPKFSPEVLGGHMERVWRQMRREGLGGALRGEAQRTTFSDPKAPCPLDRVSRVFKAERPNPVLGQRFHVCLDLAELAVRGRRGRCLRPTHRGHRDHAPRSTNGSPPTTRVKLQRNYPSS
jgi:hypothetical protein